MTQNVEFFKHFSYVHRKAEEYIITQQSCGEGNGNPLQYSCLENPMDGVAKSLTGLSNSTSTFHFHALEKEMATHSSVLAGVSQGRGSLVGCHLWGCTGSDTTEAI